MPDAEPKRHWFQFSLRLLLLVVVAGNVCWLAYSRVREAEARAEKMIQNAQVQAEREMTRAEIEMKRLTKRSLMQMTELRLKVDTLNIHKVRIQFVNSTLVKKSDALERQVTALKARLKECGCADK